MVLLVSDELLGDTDSNMDVETACQVNYLIKQTNIVIDTDYSEDSLTMNT